MIFSFQDDLVAVGAVGQGLADSADGGSTGFGGLADLVIGAALMEHFGNLPSLGDGLELFDRHQIFEKAVALFFCLQGKDRFEETVIFL